MTIERYIQARFANPFRPGIKVNLYRDYEYRATARCIAETATDAVECVMVGDSYFMTHLGRDSTQLNEETAAQALDLLPRLIAELRAEMDRNEHGIVPPMLMADIPDGLSTDQVHDVIDRYKANGAEIVKLEFGSLDDLWMVDVIGDAGLVPAIHLGYMPQKNSNQTYGVSALEVASYRRMIDAAHEAGARCVIFERLTEVANVLLTKYCLALGMLPYSIFSGRAPLGGQSINAWDSTVIAPVKSIFFPPTALITREQVAEHYKEPLIAERLGKLLKMALVNVFPPSPRNSLDLDDCIELIEEAAP